jgi:hypothetical protein
MATPDRRSELIEQLTAAARLFNGTITRTLNGVTTGNEVAHVKFPDVLKAASFVTATGLEKDANFEIAEDRFDVPVTVEFQLLAYAMCR